MLLDDLAIYIHWPFCKFKCPYCDFNSHVREKIEHHLWPAAYRREMEFYREKTGPRRVTSVFFGGGTPSLMEPSVTAAVIDDIHRLWGIPDATEITLEANPTSVEADKLRGFKVAGVNRVSLGVQALRDADLKKLGRQHSVAEALAAVKTAAGIFDRYTFDLIYARPDQTVDAWKQELDEAMAYAGGHMSMYQLTIEEGTSFHTLHQRGELIIPDEETAARMFELTQEAMVQRGMPAYEISNHARLGDESRHNLAYWRYQDYVGIGPGAHGRLTWGDKKWATRAHAAPEIWLQKVNQQGHGAHPFEEIDARKMMTEKIMMGLRLAEGIDFKGFQETMKMPLLEFLNSSRVEMLTREGLLEQTPTTLCATPAGRQRLNAVLSHLLT